MRVYRFHVGRGVSCAGLHCVRQAIEAEEDWRASWSKDFGDEEGKDWVRDIGVGGAEGGKTGEGDVGWDGDGNVGLGWRLR